MAFVWQPAPQVGLGGRVEEWKMSKLGSKTQRFFNSLYTTRKYRVFILLSFARMSSGAQKKNHSRKTFGISPYILDTKMKPFGLKPLQPEPTMRMLSLWANGEVDGIFPPSFPPRGRDFGWSVWSD